MRPAFLLLISVLIFWGCAKTTTMAVAEPDWIRFSSKQGKFSALMPFQPKFSEEKQTTSSGEVVVHSYTSNPSSNVAYCVAFTQLPDKQRERAKEHPEIYFAAATKTALGTNSTLLKERQFASDGHPAHELQFVRPPADLVTMRMYITDDRFYTTICLVRTNAAASTNIFRFLDSFHLRK